VDAIAGKACLNCGRDSAAYGRLMTAVLSNLLHSFENDLMIKGAKLNEA
jgi:hypothetical protein